MSERTSIKDIRGNYLEAFLNDKFILTSDFSDLQYGELSSLKSTNIENWIKTDFLWTNLSSLMGKTLDQDRKDNSSNENLDSSSSDVTSSSSLSDSTETRDINAINDKFLNTLRERTDSYVKLIARTDFEDGMTNDAVEEARSYYLQNKSVTINWFGEIYSKNQRNAIVISGLLRIISMIVLVSDSASLIPIVKCGLSDNSSIAQESALMVIEEWRTKECLDAIKTSNFVFSWVKDYAQKVVSELEKELSL